MKMHIQSNSIVSSSNQFIAAYFVQEKYLSFYFENKYSLIEILWTKICGKVKTISKISPKPW